MRKNTEAAISDATADASRSTEALFALTAALTTLTNQSLPIVARSEREATEPESRAAAEFLQIKAELRTIFE